MATILVHITTGPENPTKAALGCLVAATAVKQQHKVNLFLAGDGVTLPAPQTLATLEGTGTGRLSEHVTAIAAGGGRFYLSGISAKARGLDQIDPRRPSRRVRDAGRAGAPGV